MIIVAEGLLPYKWYRENLQYTYAYINMSEKDNFQPSDLSAANRGRAVCYILRDESIICEQNQ
jgi:hypothetical protein